ncbi:hypothetical protein P389DRAFT_90473 [Cystobasidium minutum MCA 4210]|uniref:uncharacterized protein n=1 Tax=Cystobasidium minutum MCA 4210 TaxID=1397322 RepID=UPI0034CDE1FD|eukprot:jgi/Rhomi1/90473/CE90472_1310
MSDNNQKEQEFSIQPHPAKDNGECRDEDPNSLTGNTPGLLGNKDSQVASQPGPHIMSKDIASTLEEPLSRDELRKRADVSSSWSRFSFGPTSSIADARLSGLSQELNKE